jgi:pantoate kinase
MKAKVFCPGHITGFFQILEHREVQKSGSRGAGICISLGATSEVETSPGQGQVTIVMDGAESVAPVTRFAVAKVLGENKLDVRVSTAHALPPGQGFGMSAAGSLSAAHALAEALDQPFGVALRAAHEAEIVNHTGLGDVAALSRGGITFRRTEGLPPAGRIDQIHADPDIVLGIVGPPISTAQVLSDPKRKQRVNEAGKECVAKLGSQPTLTNMMRLSREFMKKSGLASPVVEAAVRAAEAYGPASMIMLGNSVFAVGAAKDQQKALAAFGTTFMVKVDWRGPRVVEPRH